MKVFESKVSVEYAKFSFKKNLTRKEVHHIGELKKAQGTINVANLKEEEENKEKEDDGDPMKRIQVRPRTPIYKDIQRKDDKQ